MMEFPPAYFLMAKLEEEVQNQRKLLNVLLASGGRISGKARLRTLEHIKRLISTLKLTVMTIEATDRVSDDYTRESALLMGAECLSFTALTLELLEKSFPIFLESITLYEEPIVERMEGTLSFIESCVGKSEPSPTEEIVQSIDEIIRVLEYYVNVGERSIRDMV